ncbi:MAG: M3 family oligoendopeptidase, partial [Clostridia bacterium]|nr:M3 family oligoendopeptidase [Clostridia bacterium]
MKFSQMPYERPNVEQLKEQLSALTDRLREASDYAKAKAIFLEHEDVCKVVMTAQTLVNIRHSIDTRDTFYDEEMSFWNALSPELQEYDLAWTTAMLESPFRSDFAAEYGDVYFLNAEIEQKSFSPSIIPEVQQENELTQAYE